MDGKQQTHNSNIIQKYCNYIEPTKEYNKKIKLEFDQLKETPKYKEIAKKLSKDYKSTNYWIYNNSNQGIYKSKKKTIQEEL